MNEQAPAAPGPDESGATKKPWQSPKLTYVGDVAEIVQGGGGKLSVPGGDPGDARKDRGSG
jgi:hypothetical protein